LAADGEADAGELSDGGGVVVAGAGDEHVGGDGRGVPVGCEADDVLGDVEDDGLAVLSWPEREGQELLEDGADEGDAEKALDVAGEVGVAGEGVGEELVPPGGGLLGV